MRWFRLKKRSVSIISCGKNGKQNIYVTVPKLMRSDMENEEFVQ